MNGQVTSVMIVGVGGQGVVLAGDLLAEAAMLAGLDAKKSEVHGMAQRGGCVSSHVRFGPKVHSPLIGEARADILLGFEPAEALRNIAALKPGGRVVVNTVRIVPPLVSLGAARYPEEALELIAGQAAASKFIDAQALALEAGSPKAVNTVLLGAAAEWLPFPEADLRRALSQRLPAKIVDVNLRALELGAQQ